MMTIDSKNGAVQERSKIKKQNCLKTRKKMKDIKLMIRMVEKLSNNSMMHRSRMRKRKKKDLKEVMRKKVEIREEEDTVEEEEEVTTEAITPSESTMLMKMDSQLSKREVRNTITTEEEAAEVAVEEEEAVEVEVEEAVEAEVVINNMKISHGTTQPEGRESDTSTEEEERSELMMLTNQQQKQLLQPKNDPAQN
jgi:hypothetical protein